MWESFHNKSGATVSRKNMSINNYVQMCKILENNLLLSQNETPSKRKRPKFLIALGDFLYKICFEQYRLSKFVFGYSWSLRTNFLVSLKLLFLQIFMPKQKTDLPLIRNQFLLTIGISMVGKASFSLTQGNKRVFIFHQSEIKIIKQNLIPCNENRFSIQKEPFLVLHFFLKEEIIKNLIKNLCYYQRNRSFIQ